MFKNKTIKYGHTAIFTLKTESGSTNGVEEFNRLKTHKEHLITLEIGRFGNSRESANDDWIGIKEISVTTEDPLFLHLRIIGSKLGRKERPQYVINSAEVYMNRDS